VTCYSCHKATAIHSANRIYVLDSTQLIADGRYMDCMSCHQALRSPGFDRLTELPTVSCPPMRDDEPAIVLARERAVEALAGRAARGEAEPLDDYLMARGLIGLGRGEEGYKLLRDAARANTDNPRLAIEAARLFDVHGRSNDAIAVVRDYLAVRIGDPDVNLEHARLMLEAKDPQARDPRQALTQLELVIAGLESDDKRLIDFQLLKADALEALGQKEQAIALLQSLAGALLDARGPGGPPAAPRPAGARADAALTPRLRPAGSRSGSSCPRRRRWARARSRRRSARGSAGTARGRGPSPRPAGAS
jgi:tetratricopeptide (TPR) repeat protein